MAQWFNLHLCHYILLNNWKWIELWLLNLQGSCWSQTQQSAKRSLWACFLHHLVTATCFSTINGISYTPISSCHLMKACLPLLPKAFTHFLKILTIFFSKIFYLSQSPIGADHLLSHKTHLLGQKKNLCPFLGFSITYLVQHEWLRISPLLSSDNLGFLIGLIVFWSHALSMFLP